MTYKGKEDWLFRQLRRYTDNHPGLLSLPVGSAHGC
jgi:hypothetical protein